MKQQNKEHIIDPENKMEFKRLLKVGIYKSMFHDGIINRKSYIKLIGDEKGCKIENR